MKNLKFLAFFFTAALLLASCSSDDDNEPINEEEVITTLTASLTTPDGPTILLTYRDLDGDGPNPPVITVSGSLLPNATYTGSMILLNETESPVEDITEEIKEEDDEHQFFFQVGAGLN
ncbi:MAG: type 1 periplasmic binding fold superfamily protein, partial [Flavobacteriales bacterium]|nr:type 1 periplasmic binding fold superfamily protein [Flavobacteriales bacterium]